MFKKSIKNTIFQLIPLLVVLCFQSQMQGQKNYCIYKKYPPAQLQQDVAVLKEVILKMHPGIGIYESSSYYEKLFNDFTSGLKDSLTEKSFRIELKLLFEKLHCGHSDVLLSKAYSKAIRPLPLNFLPYYLVPLQNQLFVAMPVNRKRDSLYKPYTEILKINNISSDSICNYTRHFFTTDGYITSGKNTYMRGAFNYFYPSLFGRSDSFLIESKVKEKIETHYVKAVSLKDLPLLPMVPREDSTFTKYRRANMSFGYLDAEKKALVLRIGSFRHSHYKKAYRKIFRKLTKEKIPNLVIDLRYNGGGNLMNSYRLLGYLLNSTETATLKTRVKKYPLKQYTHGNCIFKFTRHVLGFIGKKKTSGDTIWYTQKIKPIKKYHYDKNIYVLINGGTFSASCLVAAYLKTKTQAKFIGSETSGAIEGCNAGITPYYTLPNTKVRVRIPAFRIIHNIKSEITGRGILPDYEVNYDIESLLKRKDLEFQKTRELIK